MKLPIGVIAALMFAAHGFAQSPGPIVAVGGGGTTDKTVARTLELAAGRPASSISTSCAGSGTTGSSPPCSITLR